MSTQTTPLPLAELIRLALPPDATLAAGAALKDRPITWATLVALPLGAVLPVESGDLLFLAGPPNVDRLLPALARRR